MAKQKRKQAAQAKPIIRHPLFPAVAALWFAALFGLGSLAIRPGLIESLVLKTHIDTIVPAAAPPLGVTARICIALAMAVFGGLIGAKLVAFLTRPKPEAHERKRGAGAISEVNLRRRDSHPDAPARPPISAHEEFGDDGLDTDSGSAVIPGRRRALTVEDQDTVFTVPEFAPLPGGDPQVIDLAELDLAGSEIPQAVPAPAAPAFDAVPARQEFVPQADPVTQLQIVREAGAAYAASVAEPEVRPVQTYAAPVAPPIDFARPHQVVEAASAAHGEVSSLFPREPAVPSFAAAPVSAEAPPVSAITPEAVAEAAAVALDSLGLVELTERFAATLRKRRAELAASTAALELTAAAEVPAVEPQTVEALVEPVAEPAPVAIAAEAPQAVDVPAPAPEESPMPVFAPLGADPVAGPEVAPSAPRPIPAALRPLSFDDLDEDEDFATYLPLRHIPMPVVRPVAETPVEAPAEPVAAFTAPESDEAEVAEELPEDGYSSLLAIAKPVAAPREEFVRIEEPEPEHAAIEPVVIFPGQSARQNFGQASLGQQPAPFAQPTIFTPQPVSEPAEAFAAPAEAAHLRRFDAPASAAPGQPVAANAPAPVQDPAETERALRAALATLQRMSGAA